MFPSPKMDDYMAKCMPLMEPETIRFYADCRNVYQSARVFITELSNLLTKLRMGHSVKSTELDCTVPLKTLVDGMKQTNAFKRESKGIELHKENFWRVRLWLQRLAVSRLLYEIIKKFIDTDLNDVTMRLACMYNEIVSIPEASCDVNVYCNSCPMLMYPIKKITAPRLLLMVAQKRAETTSYQLLDSLLMSDGSDGLVPDSIISHEAKDQPLSKQDSVGSDTSAEILRTLTEQMALKRKPLTCLEALIKREEHNMAGFLATIARVSPQLLSAHCIKSAPDESAKVKRPVKKKLLDYYQDVLWGEVGGYLEHGLLWWSAEPLGSMDPVNAHCIVKHLNHLKKIDFVPQSLLAATNSLLDALCCHITSVSWDQLFRKCLVASANQLSSLSNMGYGLEGSSTGVLYVNLLKELVELNNSCENGCLTLEQLPLVEQIPVIHRLDHSVHTTRLWMASRCRQLAAVWDVAQFYCIAHTDISNCLQILSKLEMANHGIIGPSTSVHVAVCAKMRGKLVSEVRANVDKLKSTLAECVNVLASNCRTQCLAHLHMSCPPSPYWRQSGPLPDCASDYVENYLDCILRPVILATEKLPEPVQVQSASMVLRILCESWLEYIYLHRIKFSEWGAVQLLTDFGSVPTWLMERVKLPKLLLTPLLTHEVLRRCEGVGRLLLRRRGEAIAMTTAGHKSSAGQEDKSADNMPAEMYVTNQEQWLELRAPRTGNICCQL